jgi:hypothetical protein
MWPVCPLRLKSPARAKGGTKALSACKVRRNTRLPFTARNVPLLRVLGPLIGTPERLETYVSHRKQKIGHQSNRYRSCDRFARFLAAELRAVRKAAAPRLRWRRGDAVRLPETANRVEMHVSHRKQRIGYVSTRDGTRHVPAPIFLTKLRAALKTAALRSIPKIAGTAAGAISQGVSTMTIRR